MRRSLAALLLALSCGVDASGAEPPSAESPGIGRDATPAEVGAWDGDSRPDGSGLPAGGGGVEQGQAVYAASCASCHGAAGTGGAAPALAGGTGSLASAKPVRTVGSYWPYATTVFDYVRRAMPFNAPHSLTDDQVYAVTAYLLHLNGIVPDDAVMDRRSLPLVRMPNRDGFRRVWRDAP